MNFKYNMIKEVKEFMKNSILIEIDIGCSNSQVIKIQKEKKNFFLKVAPSGTLTTEHKKLLWLEGKLMVPKVVLYYDRESIEYLITEAIPGEMLCSDYYEKNWKEGISIISDAFKEITKVDISKCPFKVDLEYKLNLVKNNIEKGLVDINNIKPTIKKKYKSLENIYNYLIENKEIVKEELYFSHGDTSLPNIFAHNKKFSGLIDVGESGIAEQWFDIAIAVRSITRNYGKKGVKEFYKQLGVEEDKKKVDYYLLMMELYV